MALQLGQGSSYGSSYIGGLQVAGGAGGAAGSGEEEDAPFYYRSPKNGDSNEVRAELASLLLSLLLQITNPDMTAREELMIRGNKVSPGVSEDNLRSQNVSPLAIRRLR